MCKPRILYSVVQVEWLFYQKLHAPLGTQFFKIASKTSNLQFKVVTTRRGVILKRLKYPIYLFERNEKTRKLPAPNKWSTHTHSAIALNSLRCVLFKSTIYSTFFFKEQRKESLLIMFLKLCEFVCCVCCSTTWKTKSITNFFNKHHRRRRRRVFLLQLKKKKHFICLYGIASAPAPKHS